MSKLQYKAIIDFRIMVSNCAQRSLWQPKERAGAFVIVNVPKEVLADIKGSEMGGDSCADFIEEKLTVVLDNASGLSAGKKCLNIYKKTSFILRLRKLGRSFDIKIEVGKAGRFAASKINNNNALAKLAA